MKNAKLAVITILKNKVVYCSTNYKKSQENGRKVAKMGIVVNISNSKIL